MGAITELEVTVSGRTAVILQGSDRPVGNQMPFLGKYEYAEGLIENREEER